MELQLQTAAIAAVVALATATTASIVTWHVERRKWLTALKTSLQVELHKERLRTYPAVFTILSRLSHATEPRVTRSSAGDVAKELNDWMYSAGGLTAEASTRGAVLGLRHSLREWHRSGDRPDDLYFWRNMTLLLLRRDIDIAGLEAVDGDNMGPLLAQVRRDADELTRRRRRWPLPARRHPGP